MSHFDIKSLFPTLGKGWNKTLKNASYTKKGPGRRHKTMQFKSETPYDAALNLLALVKAGSTGDVAFQVKDMDCIVTIDNEVRGFLENQVQEERFVNLTMKKLEAALA